MDRHALTCPCTCHGRGPSASCDYPNGCGHLHRDCPVCARPTADAALCPACTEHLLADLAVVPELADELDVWRAKLDRIGDRDPRGGSYVPLGYRPMAVEVADVLELTLAAWAREVATTAAVTPPSAAPAVLAEWLADQHEAARHMATVAQFVNEVGYAVTLTRRAIDRPAERVYAGPCDACRDDLYAWPRADTVTCRGCGAAYPVPERRAWLLRALREHLATAAEISMGLGELYGQPINRKTINQWHHRDRLVVHGVTRDGWPLFRIGDVLDLAEQSATRAAS